MTGEPSKLRTRDEILELDRSAWNVPEPRVGPVGPVHQVWPVREHLRPEPSGASAEEPPAAA